MLIVDRIEGNHAVCERPDRTMVVIPLSELPGGLREGDCLTPLASGGYRIDTAETVRRRQAARSLFESLRDKEE